MHNKLYLFHLQISKIDLIGLGSMSVRTGNNTLMYSRVRPGRLTKAWRIFTAL